MNRVQGNAGPAAEVYVNNERRRHFHGMTVKFAIGPEQAKRVATGAMRVVDARGYRLGLGGSVLPGAQIFVVENPGTGD